MYYLLHISQYEIIFNVFLVSFTCNFAAKWLKINNQLAHITTYIKIHNVKRAYYALAHESVAKRFEVRLATEGAHLKSIESSTPHHSTVKRGRLIFLETRSVTI